MTNTIAEQQEVAGKIKAGEFTIEELTDSIIAGQSQVHGIDLQDMVNDALGDDAVSLYAMEYIKAQPGDKELPAKTVNFLDSMELRAKQNIDQAIRNIVKEHCPCG